MRTNCGVVCGDVCGDVCGGVCGDVCEDACVGVCVPSSLSVYVCALSLLISLKGSYRSS